MSVMNYVDGNLHGYLQNNFKDITWEKKLRILSNILSGYLYLEIYNSFVVVSWN